MFDGVRRARAATRACARPLIGCKVFDKRARAYNIIVSEDGGWGRFQLGWDGTISHLGWTMGQNYM
eukprot:4835234-Pyramimonas_sp.AAC.1